MGLDSLREKLAAHGQEHLLAFYDELSPDRQERLLQQIQQIDLDRRIDGHEIIDLPQHADVVGVGHGPEGDVGILGNKGVKLGRTHGHACGDGRPALRAWSKGARGVQSHNGITDHARMEAQLLAVVQGPQHSGLDLAEADLDTVAVADQARDIYP